MNISDGEFSTGSADEVKVKTEIVEERTGEDAPPTLTFDKTLIDSTSDEAGVTPEVTPFANVIVSDDLFAALTLTIEFDDEEGNVRPGGPGCFRRRADGR